MKPGEPKPHTVFRVIEKKTGAVCDAYSRACCNESDFGSVSEARNAMFSGEYKSKGKYRVAKYRVTYELIDPDCDGAEGVTDPPPDSAQEARLQSIVDLFFKHPTKRAKP